MTDLREAARGTLESRTDCSLGAEKHNPTIPTLRQGAFGEVRSFGESPKRSSAPRKGNKPPLRSKIEGARQRSTNSCYRRFFFGAPGFLLIFSRSAFALRLPTFTFCFLAERSWKAPPVLRNFVLRVGM